MDKIEQINKLARKGRDLFEKDHENYPDEDYPNEELECFLMKLQLPHNFVMVAGIIVAKTMMKEHQKNWRH